MHNPLVFLFSLLLSGLLVWISIVDWRDLRIPNFANAALAAAGLTLASLRGGADAFQQAALAGIVVLLSFFILSIGYHQLRGRCGLGLGDAKFLGASATWVGLHATHPLNGYPN